MQDDIDRLVEEKKRAANFKMFPTYKQETPFSQDMRIMQYKISKICISMSKYHLQ